MASATENALHGQVAIVTGSGGGIGAAIAGRLARMGALTFLCGRRRTPLEGTAEAILKSGGKAEIAECDVTDLSSVEALAALSSARRAAPTSWSTTPASAALPVHCTRYFPHNGNKS